MYTSNSILHSELYLIEKERRKLSKHVLNVTVNKLRSQVSDYFYIHQLLINICFFKQSLFSYKMTVGGVSNSEFCHEILNDLIDKISFLSQLFKVLSLTHVKFTQMIQICLEEEVRW